MENQTNIPRTSDPANEISNAMKFFSNIYRDDRDGKYYGKLENGTLELINGVGSSVSYTIITNDPSTVPLPPAGFLVLFVDSTNGNLYYKDSSGNVVLLINTQLQTMRVKSNIHATVAPNDLSVNLTNFFKIHGSVYVKRLFLVNTGITSNPSNLSGPLTLDLVLFDATTQVSIKTPSAPVGLPLNPRPPGTTGLLTGYSILQEGSFFDIEIRDSVSSSKSAFVTCQDRMLSQKNDGSDTFITTLIQNSNLNDASYDATYDFYVDYVPAYNGSEIITA